MAADFKADYYEVFLLPKQGSSLNIFKQAIGPSVPLHTINLEL